MRAINTIDTTDVSFHGEFFVSRSIFSRLCRVLNVSEGAEFSSHSVYQPITGLLTKSFGQRVRNVCETVFLTLVQEGAENAQGC